MSKSGWVVSSFETTKPKKLENHDNNATEKSLAGRKRSRPESDIFQKFGNTIPKGNSDQTWLEKYCPKYKDDLAVHKRKVEDVEEWLINSLRNNNSKQRILILSGPTGCGKTITVQTLARHLKVGIQEWSNPISHRSQQPGSFQESQTQLFREFLTRADKYGNLSSDGTNLPNKLILVEDFPNAFHMDASELHEVLRRYKAVGHSPLVLVVTDCYERSLLPKDFQQELGSTLISFNPIAPTNLLKALTRIAWKGSEVKPTKEVLQELSETANGDIRAAVNSLQFYCSGTSNRSRGKQKQKVGERDSNLVIFRGLGKILYCKREGSVEKHHTLPAHLKQFERSRLVNDPQDILRKTPMTPSSLSLFLHENYVPFFPGLEDLVRASDYFSVADALDCEWASKDTLEEYAAYITTLGLMNSNRASGVSSTCGTKGRWRPLHKPEYFKANKTILQRTTSARQLFVVNCGWPSEELFTVRLPYLQVLKPPWLLPGQKFFVQELCSGTRNRINRDVFDDRDHFFPEVFHQEMMEQKWNDVDVIPVTVEDSNNPEMMIEEFSD